MELKLDMISPMLVQILGEADTKTGLNKAEIYWEKWLWKEGRILKEVWGAIRPLCNLDPCGRQMEGRLGRKSLRLQYSFKKVSVWLMGSP